MNENQAIVIEETKTVIAKFNGDLNSDDRDSQGCLTAEGEGKLLEVITIEDGEVVDRWSKEQGGKIPDGV
ncbi:MAG TPA: hypothetical protein VJ742_12275 [Nitrososphaera sp.]|nr:hypothetical protein [Nitrososphaera sp.]